MNQKKRSRFYPATGKRLFDIAVVLVLLPVLLPVLIGLSVCVALFLGRPVFFRQLRPGLNGKCFTLLKFRTMTDARDSTGQLLADEKRLTRFGKFLRASSLDELPELWNVLKGEMSLVGPRPLLVEYLEKYSPQQARRHNVRPGITGWAQVNGRNEVDWQQRFEMDTWYVDHCSFWLDLKIAWLTIKTVLGRSGISAQGHATMPRFDRDIETSGSPAVCDKTVCDKKVA